MALVTAIEALLHVAKGSSPFTTAHAFYSTVDFVFGYPSSDAAIPSVAVYPAGGNANARELGSVDQDRYPTLQVSVLTRYKTEAFRLIEKVTEAWKQDFNCEGGGSLGSIGKGYLRVSGELKNIQFSEPVEAEWENASRLVSEISLWIRD
jgi:hypothetical protein